MGRAQRNPSTRFKFCPAYRLPVNSYEKIKQIDTGRHFIVKSAHPSPLSAKKGFFGSRPFSRVNAALKQAGKAEIDWQIPDI